MLQKFKAWLIKQLSAPEKIAAPAHSTGATGQIEHEDAQNIVPYDENLLERSRTQWPFGDSESLPRPERDTLQLQNTQQSSSAQSRHLARQSYAPAC